VQSRQSVGSKIGDLPAAEQPALIKA